MQVVTKNLPFIDENIRFKTVEKNKQNQISGDKQTPTDRQTLIGEDQDTPYIEFIPFDDEEIKSVTEFDCSKEPRFYVRNTTQMSSNQAELNRHYYYTDRDYFSQEVVQAHPDNEGTEDENALTDRQTYEFNIQDNQQEEESEEESGEKQHKFKSTYLVQSQYLSGITEKSEEESRGTSRPFQSSYYAKERENVNSTLLKHEAFQSSQSSSKSSRINSRLLRYFEDSLQREIQISFSPSVKPGDKSGENAGIKEQVYSKSHAHLFANPEYGKNDDSSSDLERDENSPRRLRKSQDHLSNYSLSKSNNYDDLHCVNTSSKKKK